MSVRVYVDSNVLIYYVDVEPRFRSLAESALSHLVRDGSPLISSEITVGECLRGAPQDAPEVSAIFLTLLTNEDFVSLSPVSLALILRAAELGATLNMKLIDALHVATAEASGCTILLTNDGGIRAPAGIEIKRLGQTGQA